MLITIGIVALVVFFLFIALVLVAFWPKKKDGTPSFSLPVSLGDSTPRAAQWKKDLAAKLLDEREEAKARAELAADLQTIAANEAEYVEE